MAEAIAVLGVAAAALQFAEAGYKVISRCSFLMKRSREYPDYIHRTHSQMQHLIYLAKVAADSRDTSHGIISFELQYAVGEDAEQQPQSANNPRAHAAMIPIQMETIWKDCSHQAGVIDDILQIMMREIEGRGLIGKWRQLSQHDRVCSIERALGELERSKTTLGLWLGNESLYRIERMHHDIAIMHNQIVHSEQTLSRMFEEYHRKTENTVLAMIQSKPATKILDAKSYDKKNWNTEIVRRAPSVVIPNPSNQGLNSSKAKSSAPGRSGKNIEHTITLLPNVMKVVKWSKVLTVAGNTIVLRVGSQGTRSLAFTSEDDRNMFLNVYMGLRMSWLFDFVEFNFSFQQYPGNPSIRASLRAQIRVWSLPLTGLFLEIYGIGWTWNRRRVSSPEEQLHLFSVARKLLLEMFYAGDAFPNAINMYGQTLLHLQAELYVPGYETIFTKMIEFLVSRGVDTELVDNNLRTAQSRLCQTLTHENHRNIVSYNVAAESQLAWSGFVKREAMGASRILQCIRHWPEAILDMKYQHICDIVLRKSMKDLQKLQGQKDPDSAQRERSNSPLHFAAAASWPAGVEAPVSMGYPRFERDEDGQFPLDIAVGLGCIDAVETLLKGNCLTLFTIYTHCKDTTLPRAFLKAAESDDSRMHDAIIECLLRHKFLLPRLLPYHALVDQRYKYFDNITFAQRLFNAGFQDIEAYNHSGYTPLMISCVNGNTKMASFLLQHGADPFKCHEHVCLTAGHFLCYDGIYPPKPLWRFRPFVLVNQGGFRSKEDEKRLLESAFNTSINIESSCRCSPDSFTPVKSLFQIMGRESTFDLKESFQIMIRNVDYSTADMRKHWRAFVVCETFNRLGMTHTCLNLHSPGRLFPDNRRIEIEDEEQELFFELEEVAARFDLFSENRDDLSDCVDEFFDDLDFDLQPRPQFSVHRQDGEWNHRSPGCLGPGETFYVETYLSSRGEKIKYGHKEIVEEESMLRWLFP